LKETGSDRDGNLILERENGSGATVRGINLDGKIIPSKNLQFQFGMTFQKSRYKEAQQWSDDMNLVPQRKMFRSPDQYGYITTDYQFVKNLNISLSGTYTGSMLVQHFAGYVAEDAVKNTSAFYDLNIKLSYGYKLSNSVKLQLSGGIINIFNSYQDDFDKGVFRDAGYIYGPALPKSFFFGIKITV